MFVTKLFMIGNVTVPSSWISLIIAFIVAYIAVRIRYGKRSADVLLDAIFYFVLVWKLSVIVTDFGTIIKSPLSIIYFHGGVVGFYLGLFAAGVTILIDAKKKGLGLMDRVGLFTGVVTIQSVYQVLMALFNEGSLVARSVTVAVFILFVLFVWIVIEKPGSSLVQFGYLFLAVHLFVAAFQPAGLLGAPVIGTLLISLFFTVVLFRKRHIESEGPL